METSYHGNSECKANDAKSSINYFQGNMRKSLTEGLKMACQEKKK
jgi:hypothetical protein